MNRDSEFRSNIGRLAPIFVATPSLNGSEFLRPKGWQLLDRDGNRERLKVWQDGLAVCAVMGERVAVVDVDPRNGGDIEQVRTLLAELGVTVFGEVATPGLGRHFYVHGHRDLPHCNNLVGFPGVDVQSHGSNVFLPGTQRPKYDGGGYTVILDNLLALADGGNPDGAEALVGFVAEHRAAATAEPFVVSAPWTGRAPDKRQAAYLRAVLDNQRDKVAQAVAPNRNLFLFEAAMACGNFIAGAGLEEIEVIDLLKDAASLNGYAAEHGEGAVHASIQSGLRNGKARPRAVPEPREQVTILETGMTVDPATGEVIDPEHLTPAGDAAGDAPERARRIVLTPASSIKPQRVTWLWDGRQALGTLGLLAGREGTGKSTLAYWVAAQVTRGLLPGEHYGNAKAVMVCATEDSWEHTIVPRLIAAAADLDKVFRVEMVTADDLHYGLALPRDLAAVEESAEQIDAALLLLDPLMSRLSEDLDTHRDGDVRRALEPLVAVARRVGLAVVGIIHHNKSGSTDPLQLVMASRAFTAVARSVHTVMPDPDDETGRRRLFGTPKNNLGRDDLPTLSFTIDGFPVETDDGTAWTGRVEWGEELAESITETMRRAGESEDNRTAASEAAAWMGDYLEQQGGCAPSADIKRAGQRAGHSDHSLRAARKRLGLWVKSEGFPRVTFWGNGELVDP